MLLAPGSTVWREGSKASNIALSASIWPPASCGKAAAPSAGEAEVLHSGHGRRLGVRKDLVKTEEGPLFASTSFALVQLLHLRTTEVLS